MAGEDVGEASGEKLVGDDAEGVDVGAGVDFGGVAGGLFGGHVVEGSEEGTDFGSGGGGVEVGVGGFGEAEVEDFGLAGVGDEDVGGFQIAVDDALGVGVVDGVGDEGDEGEAFAKGEVFRLGVGVEREAVDELHGEVGLETEGRVLSSGVEDGGDIGMLEKSEDFGFEVEAFEGGRGKVAGTNDLEGDDAVGLLLDGFVDRAHAAFADEADDDVGPDGGGEERGSVKVR